MCFIAGLGFYWQKTILATQQAESGRIHFLSAETSFLLAEMAIMGMGFLSANPVVVSFNTIIF